jgi:hypothetical protein
MFPLPQENVLRYRTRQNVGGISILAPNTKYVPDSAAHILLRAVLWIRLWLGCDPDGQCVAKPHRSDPFFGSSLQPDAWLPDS